MQKTRCLCEVWLDIHRGKYQRRNVIRRLINTSDNDTYQRYVVEYLRESG